MKIRIYASERFADDAHRLLESAKYEVTNYITSLEYEDASNLATNGSSNLETAVSKLTQMVIKYAEIEDSLNAGDTSYARELFDALYDLNIDILQLLEI